MDRNTGQPLSGWAHVEQSIAVILTTPIGTRVMRREFGSEVMDIIDRPMTPRVILALYAAVAQALARWEPRFTLTGVRIDSPSRDGVVNLVLRGDYEGSTVNTEVAL